MHIILCKQPHDKVHTLVIGLCRAVIAISSSRSFLSETTSDVTSHVNIQGEFM